MRADRSRLRWLKLKHPQRVLAVAVGIGVRIAAHATTSGFLPSYREADRLRPFNNAARGSTQRLQRRDRLAHDPSAALGQGDQILTQPVDVLLHRQATNFAVTIPEPDARPVAPKELSLNRQRRVAGPAADPDNTSYGSVPTRNSDQKPERDWNLCSIRALRELGGLARKAATSCGEPVAISSASAPRSRRPQA